ncbi:MAG TPA: carboxypeptidase regulatory-like domain-containing protein [Terriglobia bacterium]|nr:carboxypeptidase regulatory-like domain-containing protein [Terriglobia bacterium]
MKRFATFLVTALLVSFLSSAQAWAQAGAQISGIVKDPSGAVLPGAEVTATQMETGIARMTVSNETGAYVLPNLPVGPYKLEASLPGFRTFVQTGIVLEVNSNPVVNVTLDVGQRTEQVEVQANAALVETRNVGVGQTMEFRRILELPLNGRMVTELITLGGGAVDIPQYSSQPRSMQGQAAISVAGGLPSGVNYSLDGGMHTNPYDHLSLPLPFPDALQEFKVETGALSAAQGQHSGAQVSSVTKSGTNEFHGDVFEFVRNDLLNATQYFARVDPNTGKKVHSTLKRNQFGGTLGGPIVQSKLFFFGGYQGTTERSDPSNVQRFVPTPAMLTGDFRTVTSPACGKNLTLPSSLGFTNNQIDQSLLNPIAVNLAKKLPQTSDPCGLVIIGVPAKVNTHQFVGKTDWQLNSEHSVMGRVLFTKESQPVPYSLAPDNLLTTFDRGRSNLAQSYALGDTWLVSPKTVVSTRLVANYTDIKRLGAAFFNFGDLGVKNFFSGYQPKYLQLTVNDPGFALGGGTANDSTYRTFSGGLNMDASLSRGAHQWAVGGALQWIDSNSNANVTSSGSFTFGSQFTGLPLADFLLGKPSSFTQSTPNTDYMRKWYVALYVADTWKVNQRWTVSYGLRWEPDLAETLTLGRVATYSEQRRADGIRSTVFKNAPLGFYFPGDPGFPGKRGRDRNIATFAPRLGFAWDVKGDGKTSVRASAGLGYDYPNAQYHLWTSIIPPFGQSSTIPNPTFDDPWSTPGAGFNGVSPFPVQLSPNSSFVSFGGFTTMSNINPAQVQNWNLSIQRQLGNDWLVSANYLGSHTIHILGSEQLNPAIYVPGVADNNGNCFYQGIAFKPALNTNVCSTTGNTNQRRRLSLIDPLQTGRFVGNLVEIQSGGTSNYNGLLLEARKRAARGVTLTANHTWSHCMGPFQGNEAGDTGANPAIPNVYPGDRDRGRGNCLGDRRQVTNLTSVLEMPRFQKTTLRYLASGWQLSTIYRHTTGAYFSIVAGNNNDFARNGTNINSQPAVNLGADPIGDHSGGPLTFWFNKNAFTTPAVGTLGNVGTRSVVGPGHWDFNVGLSRSFQIKERQRFDFRWEVFNVPNSFRPLPTSASAPLVNDVTNSSLFGQLRASDDPRIMQFALRYQF